MEKELSIETIKKEIIDRMINNVEVLKYLNADKFIGKDGKLSDIYNALIFDYDSGNNNGSYIAVEVAEHEVHDNIKYRAKKYIVSIKLGLEHKKNLDKFASLIKDIVSELFPGRHGLSDVPFYTKEYSRFIGSDFEYQSLNRLITFEIEE